MFFFVLVSIYQMLGPFGSSSGRSEGWLTCSWGTRVAHHWSVGEGLLYGSDTRCRGTSRRCRGSHVVDGEPVEAMARHSGASHRWPPPSLDRVRVLDGGTSDGDEPRVRAASSHLLFIGLRNGGPPASSWARRPRSGRESRFGPVVGLARWRSV